MRLLRFTPSYLMLFALVGAPYGCTSKTPSTNTSASGNPVTAPSPSAGSGKFINVAEQSGLAAFQHTDGSSGRKYFPEQIGSGVALFDYDNDGWLDVYFCSGAPLPGYKGPKPSNKLFRNKQDGTFEDVTDRAGVANGGYCIGVAAGDYDNDGWMDLFVCAFGGNTLYHNNGNGTFADVTKQAGVGAKRLSSSAAWGDYDGDGRLDLFVGNYAVYDIKKDLWCSKTGGKKSYCGPTLYPPERSILYHNEGNGIFKDVTVQTGIAKKNGKNLGIVWLDYNDDNRPDVFVANDQSPNHLWRNNGNGTFTDVAEDLGVAFGEQGNAQAGMGVDAGDFNNDGKIDIIVTNFSEETNALYLNENGLFRDISYPSGMGPATLMYLGFGIGFIDYDRDGMLDLFFANGHVMDDINIYSDSVTWEQPNQLFRNLGNSKFTEVSQPTGIGDGKRVSRGAAFGDLFNDGHTHIVVNVLRGKPLVMKNECAPGAHWLELDLKAASGNPQAIGAKIWLKAGGKLQYREVKTGGSYASSSDPRPFFGLGENTQIEELKIRWPSGKTTIVSVPQSDRILKVEEAASTAQAP